MNIWFFIKEKKLDQVAHSFFNQAPIIIIWYFGKWNAASPSRRIWNTDRLSVDPSPWLIVGWRCDPEGCQYGMPFSDDSAFPSCSKARPIKCSPSVKRWSHPDELLLKTGAVEERLWYLKRTKVSCRNRYVSVNRYYMQKEDLNWFLLKWSAGSRSIWQMAIFTVYGALRGRAFGLV